MGLHVRLNIYTGQKEAKINVPDEVVDSSLEGLPVDKSIVIVDPDAESSEEQPQEQGQAKGQPLKPPRNAPAYDPDGKIKEPVKQTAESQEEGSAFYKSLTILKKGLDIDQALEMLEDISHDIYYGLKIAEDYDTVRELFCLANSPVIFSTSSGEGLLAEKDVMRARLAALTISSTVQNNPKALAEISKHWTTGGLQKDTCTKSKTKGSEAEPLQISTFRLLPSSSSSSSSTVPASLTKARVSAISGLLKSPSIRESFLSANGMDLLLSLLLSDPTTTAGSQDEWEKVRRQAGHLILDNFLDEDMGAVLGEWPDAVRDAQASDKECASRVAEKSQGNEKEGQGECWDWHAKQLADRYKKEGKGGKGHWSWELWSKLKEQRKNNASSGKKSKGGKKDEL